MKKNCVTIKCNNFYCNEWGCFCELTGYKICEKEEEISGFGKDCEEEDEEA